MHDVFELFCRYAQIRAELHIKEHHYRDVPNRRHKKRRIQKKWLKRYGSHRELAAVTQREIFSIYDIKPHEMNNPIYLRVNAKASPRKQLRHLEAPKIVLANVEMLPTANESVIYEKTTFEFPAVARVHRISYGLLQEIVRNDEIRKIIFDQFLKEVEIIVRNETKINNVNEYGVLADSIIE